jgi:hypothetical protein
LAVLACEREFPIIDEPPQGNRRENYGGDVTDVTDFSWRARFNERYESVELL